MNQQTMAPGDYVEIWETVDGSEYVRLLREAHPYSADVDPPDVFIETIPPHRTFKVVGWVTELRQQDGARVHKVLTRLGP